MWSGPCWPDSKPRATRTPRSSALSVGDYPCLEPVVETLMAKLAPRRISLSLSSLRPKRLSPEIVEAITKVRRTGFTLVPEAATERLRRVINKPVEDRELWEAAESAFRRGWRLLKLYLMIGLPSETDEDIAAIPLLVRELAARGRAILGGPPRIHVSLALLHPQAAYALPVGGHGPAGEAVGKAGQDPGRSGSGSVRGDQDP